MSVCSDPYINTHLYDTITLHANQMNNDIYKHLKTNLIKKYQNKCFNKYGYISKIHKIEEKSGGRLIPEDPMASAVYDIKFLCKLCRPLKKSIIVCEVIKINKSLVYLRNGPINIIIFEESGHINKDNFVFDEKKNLLVAYADKNKDKGIPVIKGTFVKVKVINICIENNSQHIIVIGTLENIASKSEIEQAIKSREDDNLQFIDYNKYIESEQIMSPEISEQLNSTESMESEGSDEIADTFN